MITDSFNGLFPHFEQTAKGTKESENMTDHLGRLFFHFEWVSFFQKS